MKYLISTTKTACACFTMWAMIVFAGSARADVESICEFELEAHQQRVFDAYIAYYGRPADWGGLFFWTAKLDEAGGDLSAIIDAFATSREFQQRYGSLSTEELIAGLYEQIFDRGPDEAGLAFYSTQLEAGTRTLQSIALDIFYGASGRDALVLANRQFFAQQYLCHIILEPSATEILTAERLANLMSNVGASETSLILALGLLSFYVTLT